MEDEEMWIVTLTMIDGSETEHITTDLDFDNEIGNLYQDLKKICIERILNSE